MHKNRTGIVGGAVLCVPPNDTMRAFGTLGTASPTHYRHRFVQNHSKAIAIKNKGGKIPNPVREKSAFVDLIDDNI